MNYFALDKDVTLDDLQANDELEDSMSDFSDDDEKFEELLGRTINNDDDFEFDDP